MNLISPRFICGNRGDIASRYGILNTLQRGGAVVSAVFACRVAHLPQALQRSVLPYGPMYNIWPRRQGIQALRRASAVIWTGGLDLQDDSSLLKLVHTLLVFASYRLLGLRILVALQGAGPLTTPLGRWLAARILRLTNLVLVRDRGSHDLLRNMLPDGRLRLASDGIFLPGFPERGDPFELPSGIEALCAAEGRPVIGLNIRLWFHFANTVIPYRFRRGRFRKRAQARMEVFLSAITTIVTELRRRKNARIVLVSMYEPGVESWEDDAPLLQQIKDRFAEDSEVVLLTDDLPVLDLCALIARFDLMIGTRLHSTLIALRGGVPAIHLAYTLKGHDIYADLGLSDWAFGIDQATFTPQAVVATAERILSDPQRFNHVRALVGPIVATNERALQDALRCLNRRLPGTSQETDQ
ncbi:MAG: polysaccharide pyruvyl transferase family protein [Acidobacteriaceae bacterium]|nr:polysaccharide pyruvyl transferase family protein [Acidobacteriaceae bacterium]MBV9940187.1 polysaccharide pyruvyl transferase family protein [Acidobacteriaceae bacterium]